MDKKLKQNCNYYMTYIRKHRNTMLCVRMCVSVVAQMLCLKCVRDCNGYPKDSRTPQKQNHTLELISVTAALHKCVFVCVSC